MERIIKLSKFRNIGLKEEERFVLNISLEKNKIGDLVILIGPNNSGKSNVLDALGEFSSGKFSDRDITTLSYDEKDRIPQLTFEVKDSKVIGKCLLTYGQDTKYEMIELNKNIKLTNEQIKLSLNKIIDYLKQLQIQPTVLEEIYSKQGKIDDLGSIFNALDNLEKTYSRGRNYYYESQRNQEALLLQLVSFDEKNPLISLYKDYRTDSLSRLNKYFSDTYGISFIPKIYQYREEFISSDDMIVTPSNLSNSSFFKALFKAIGIDSSEIINAYQQFNKFHNPAILNKIKKIVNSKITNLNDEFNRLYFADNDKYEFTIELESNNISFGMARGDNEDPIMIEYQSTGFRWFFNLYFKFLCGSKLNPGDIVIMDEPATHLHPQGQIELRRFIKEFAIRNGITFVIATHMPFLIDIDNYDELRVVSMNNNITKIDNLFTAVSMDDPDSLIPIKESLTIKQNVLYDYETQVVWVEGITDYNYLTMFKNLLGIKNISFIPFKGVGLNDNNQLQIIKKLKDIFFPKRMILVDGDKAGLAFKNHCKGTCFESRIATIGDLTTDKKKFIEIEDMFSSDDKIKFLSLNKDSDEFKKANYTSLMKKTCSLDDFSKETIDNFKNLFSLLTE